MLPGAPVQQGLAGWWSRVGASVLDSLVIGVALLVLEGAGLSSTAAAVVRIVAFLAYTTVMLGTTGRTVGMMAVGTACVDPRTGTRPSLGKAFGRQVVEVALIFTLIGSLLDILWPLWDSRNQTLHDKAVGLLVVRTRSAGPVMGPPQATAWGSGSQYGQQPWGQSTPTPSQWGQQPWGTAPPGPQPAPPPTVPAGWYPDPAGSGQQRWWDGLGWTDHLHPGA